MHHKFSRENSSNRTNWNCARASLNRGCLPRSQETSPLKPLRIKRSSLSYVPILSSSPRSKIHHPIVPQITTFCHYLPPAQTRPHRGHATRQHYNIRTNSKIGRTNFLP